MILLFLAACGGPTPSDDDTAGKPDDGAPTVHIEGPTEGAELRAGEDLVLVATVADDETAVEDLVVRFEDGGVGELVGSASRIGDTYTLTVSGGLPVGEHTLYAWAQDEAGHAADDHVAVVVIEEDAPLVAFLSPTDGAVLPVDAPVRVEVAVDDDDAGDAGNVVLAWSGTAAGGGLPSQPDADGIARAELTLGLGEWTLAVEATDGRGEVGAAEVVFTVALPDRDGDGHPDAAAGGDDCDDADASVYPGAPELCDGDDDDCDDEIDEGVVPSWYADEDGDGWGDGAASVAACEAPPDTAAVDGDCDDGDAAVFPGAPEVCNGEDDDCDGAVDDGAATAWFPDLDADGYGDAAGEVLACEAPDGMIATGGDCDDGAADVHPGAVEVCDEVDDDCDGAVDEGLASTWYGDADGDGFGDGGSVVSACAAPTGYVGVAGDCDDTRAYVYPTAPELCDELDDDCDGAVDEGVTQTFFADLDDDGWGDFTLPIEACEAPAGYVLEPTDCDDADPSVNPGAPEVCDERDDDCDGDIDEGVQSTFYADRDGDGYGNPEEQGLACEVPEGYLTTAGDCDDDHADVHPGATETCDSRDEDCDGSIDEGVLPTWYYDGDGDGVGLATVVYAACPAPAGYVATVGDCDDTDATVYPGAVEICDEVDNDCDRHVDEGLSRSTYYGDADADGYGVATSVTSACRAPEGYADNRDDCDDTDDAVNPGALEVCGNGVDDDCSGGDETCTVPGYSLADATARYQADSRREALGAVLAGGSDLDGDGAPDVVFGVEEARGSDGSRGVALVFSGGAWGDLDETDAFLALAGPTSSALAGSAVLLPGDLDGDGLDDLLVAGRGGDGAYSAGGAAWLLPGPLATSASLAAAEATLEGEAAGEGFPTTLAAAGDVTGDGVPDVLAWVESAGVYAVVTGWPSGEGGWRSWSYVVTPDRSSDGGEDAAAAPAGDLDGDGVDDLAIGAPGAASDDGAVWIFLGALGGDVAAADADVTWTGAGGEQLAQALAGDDDLDGDGLADVVVGAPAADGVGVVYLFGGATLASGAAADVADGVVLGTESGADFGSRLALPGDVDGDGAPDLAVAAPDSAVGGRGGGLVYLFGHPTLVDFDDASATLAFHPELAGDALGAVVPAGDVDGDGDDDLLLGAPEAWGGAGGGWLVLGGGL